MWSANHFCSIEGFFFVASLLSESYFMPPAEQGDIVVTGDINHKHVLSVVVWIIIL